MNKGYLEKKLILSSVLGTMLTIQPALAQVIGDDTLPPDERSRVTGNLNAQINGGARRGGNLFHSFSEFSISTGGSAFFNNAADVENIFSRVTGNSRSSIDGLIRANGTANVFLLNPNGILFGPNARLEIGGSFVASTADRLNFEDGFQFSGSSDRQVSSLLTVSAPVGLQFGQDPASIRVLGNGHRLAVEGTLRSPTLRSDTVTGLEVQPGRTLALIGGAITLEGGTLTAEQGRVELGGVGREQSVMFRLRQPEITFNYSDVDRFRNVGLAQRALVDASGEGSIQVQGDRISLNNASLLLIQNQGNQDGGSISVDAKRLLTLQSTDRDGRLRSGLDTQNLGTGNGAEIAIAADQLVVRDGASISARSFGQGRSGNVTVNVSHGIQVLGFSPFDLARTSSIGSVALSSGDAGNITLSSQHLTVRNGGSIAVSTLGDGDGGVLTVNADDRIKISGVRNTFLFSNLSAVAQGNGDGGEIRVNTARLVIRNGGTMNSSTVAVGNAGSVSIHASDSIEISGVSPFGNASDEALRSSVGASAPLTSEELQQIFDLPPLPIGLSGDVSITTPRLSVTNGATIETNHQGVGDAGTLSVNARSIVLDRNGSITSATASGEGGNINIRAEDALILRRNSQITASARGSGNGGNIALQTPLLATVADENSDIRANSVGARGGNIEITASGIFGTQFRDRPTPLSDITATGANSSLNGVVLLDIENRDLGLPVNELPSTPIDTLLVAQGCAETENSSFIVTGRGGIAPTIDQRLGTTPAWRDRRNLSPPQNGPFSEPLSPQVVLSQSSSLVEATGWNRAATGEIILMASAAPQLHSVSYRSCIKS